MRLESLKYLHDVQQSVDSIARFCAGESFERYSENLMLRSAVERQGEIAGEALSQLAKIDAQTFERVPDARQIVAFRNFLIHGYATINNRLVWGVVINDVASLKSAVTSLLEEGETP